MKTTTPATTDVRRSPTTYPATDWLISPPTREYRSARLGDITERSQVRILGASRRRTTKTNVVPMATITAAAPLPSDRAGLLRPSAKLMSLGEFRCTHDSMW